MSTIMIRFSRFLTVLLVSVVFFGVTAFMSSPEVQTFAKPLTPEAASYEIDQATSPEEAGEKLKNQAKNYKQELDEDSQYTQKAAKNAPNGLKSAIDTVREKLNLDEPIYSGTKEFADDVKDTVTGADDAT